MLNVVVYVNEKRVANDKLGNIEICKPTVSRILSLAEMRVARQRKL